jgi:hypothetical protein
LIRHLRSSAAQSYVQIWLRKPASWTTQTRPIDCISKPGNDEPAGTYFVGQRPCDRSGKQWRRAPGKETRSGAKRRVTKRELEVWITGFIVQVTQLDELLEGSEHGVPQVIGVSRDLDAKPPDGSRTRATTLTPTPDMYHDPVIAFRVPRSRACSHFVDYPKGGSTAELAEGPATVDISCGVLIPAGDEPLADVPLLNHTVDDERIPRCKLLGGFA